MNPAQAIANLESQLALPAAQRNQQAILEAMAVLTRVGHSELTSWAVRAAAMLTESTGERVTPQQLGRLLQAMAGVNQVSQGPGGGVPAGTTSTTTPGQTTASATPGATPPPTGLPGFAELGGAAGAVGAGPPPPPLDDDLPQFIGVPPKFQPEVRRTTPSRFRNRGRGSMVDGQYQGIDPATNQQLLGTTRYVEGDQFSPQGLSPNTILKRQKELERAGLLKKGSYVPGFWDQASSDALRDAMGYANRGGRSVDAVIRQLATTPQATQPKPPRERVVLPRPDAASIAQDVKSVMRNRLGREPSAAEMRELAGKLSGVSEAAISAEEEFRNRPTAAELWEEGGMEAAQIQATTSAPFREIDPAARFLEFFDQKFGPEIRRNEAVSNVAAQHNNLFSSLVTMQSLVGEGR